MPRHRHDSVSEDSEDSSQSPVYKGHRKKNKKTKGRQDIKRKVSSPEKVTRTSRSIGSYDSDSRSESEGDRDEGARKKSKKKSVMSKVEKGKKRGQNIPNTPDRGNRGSGVSSSDFSPDKRRLKERRTSPEGEAGRVRSQRTNDRVASHSRSPIRSAERNRMRNDFRTNRSLSRERHDSRDARKSRNDSSPRLGRAGHRERELSERSSDWGRDRSEGDIRDRRNERNQNQKFYGDERYGRGNERSRRGRMSDSPPAGGNARLVRDSYRSEQSEKMAGQRGLSPEVRRPGQQDKGRKSGRRKAEEDLRELSDTDVRGPSRRMKKDKWEANDSFERGSERERRNSPVRSHSQTYDIPTESRKNKGGKGERQNVKRSRDDSLSESSTRNKRQKEDSDKMSPVETKVKKKNTKNESKKKSSDRKRSRSGSESFERSPTSSLKKKPLMKKKSAKTVKKVSASRSPSPVERLVRQDDLDRSRSAEIPVGRNHDMARFESEPESGEITDSDDNAEGKQTVVKSFINKPSSGAKDTHRSPGERKKTSRSNPKKSQVEESVNQEKTSKRRADTSKEKDGAEPEPKPEAKVKETAVGTAVLTGRTGGAYIPPARLRAMQASITDKTSVEYQRFSWEALKKSINGLVNKVNVSNIEHIVREMFQENIVRGRGLMARSIIQAQAASPTFTHVYAALVSVINTKFPQNGELILKRLILQFRRGFKRNDKSICLSATRFIAHLVNQQVAHEVLALEIITLLLETPTDDSVEVAIGFLKECGQKLTELTPRGINAIFESLRKVLHEGLIDTRVQYMVEVMFAVRKDLFKDFPALIEDLDLVEEDDQFTHLLSLDDGTNGEEMLNIFRPDPNFAENEEKYKILKKEILGEGSSDDDDDENEDSGSGSDEDDSDEEEEEAAKQMIIDQTETNLVALRRTIYLTIQSSLDFEECAHKLMKMELKPGQEVELCNMILDCCAQMRTYEKFFGLLAGRFCMIDKKYVEPFQVMFQDQYSTIHRLETNKLRNVAKFFAHLLHTDSLSWAVLASIKLNEEDTTSASRIFIKILFQELSEYMGLPKLNERLKDQTLQEYFVGLLPRENPRDTRFAINFFTTIGLGGLTDDLRDHLKNVSKKLMQQKQEEQVEAESESSDTSDEESDASSDSSDNSSDSDSSDSDSTDDNSRRRKKKTERKKGRTKGDRIEGSRDNSEIVGRKTKKQLGGKQNGSVDKSGTREKKNKRARNMENERELEEVSRREREDNFRRLAKLADYGDVGESNLGESMERLNEKKLKRKKKDRESFERIRKSDHGYVGERQDRDIDGFERSYRDGPEFGREREREQFEGRRDLDRSFERNFDERNSGRGERRGGRRDRKFMEEERDDRSVRIERNFERMDVYEDKFRRERERNLEVIRDRGDFEDYYRGRREAAQGGFDERGRGFRDERGRFDLADMGWERDVEGRRRHKSEERMVAPREERRKRR